MVEAADEPDEWVCLGFYPSDDRRVLLGAVRRTRLANPCDALIARCSTGENSQAAKRDAEIVSGATSPAIAVSDHS